ncbi:hypothetical protein [Pseudolabrys sp.]|uniref:hypothetical protein n=1 Tax=Pseudolabrys sp. TaxID=1960880 RepID=UPI003D0A00D5
MDVRFTPTEKQADAIIETAEAHGAKLYQDGVIWRVADQPRETWLYAGMYATKAAAALAYCNEYGLDVPELNPEEPKTYPGNSTKTIALRFFALIVLLMAGIGVGSVVHEVGLALVNAVSGATVVTDSNGNPAR